MHHHYCEIEWLQLKHLSMIMDPMLVNDDYYSFATVLCRGCSFAYFTQVWQSVEWDYLSKHGNSCNSILLTKHPLWKFNFCSHKKNTVVVSLFDAHLNCLLFCFGFLYILTEQTNNSCFFMNVNIYFLVLYCNRRFHQRCFFSALMNADHFCLYLRNPVL